MMKSGTTGTARSIGDGLAPDVNGDASHESNGGHGGVRPR
jgi:hypothetical protein